MAEVYEDEIVEYNPILGKLSFVNDFSKCVQREAGQADKIVGYYAYYELLTGTFKGLYMTKQQVINHAQKYSVAYQKKKMDSPWFTNFDEMAKKTVLKRLLSKFGILSVEMQKAVTEDQKVYDSFGDGEYADNKPVIEEEKPEAVKEIVEAIVETPAEKAEEKPAEPVNDFAEFEANFMNAPDDLPFK